MKKILYIIPGFQETCRRKPYKSLAKIAEQKGYKVVFKNVDWNKKLSQQVFPTTKDSVVFGFSLGAILAWLVVQDYPCRHVILASMTPHYSFNERKIKKSLIDILGSQFVNDVIKNLNSKHQSKKQTILYGDLEEEPGDILVFKTEHKLSDQYIKEIAKLL